MSEHAFDSSGDFGGADSGAGLADESAPWYEQVRPEEFEAIRNTHTQIQDEVSRLEREHNDSVFDDAAADYVAFGDESGERRAELQRMVDESIDRHVGPVAAEIESANEERAIEQGWSQVQQIVAGVDTGGVELDASKVAADASRDMVRIHEDLVAQGYDSDKVFASLNTPEVARQLVESAALRSVPKQAGSETDLVRQTFSPASPAQLRAQAGRGGSGPHGEFVHLNPDGSVKWN